jgi:hypothetical protein
MKHFTRAFIALLLFSAVSCTQQSVECTLAPSVVRFKLLDQDSLNLALQPGHYNPDSIRLWVGAFPIEIMVIDSFFQVNIAGLQKYNAQDYLLYTGAGNTDTLSLNVTKSWSEMCSFWYYTLEELKFNRESQLPDAFGRYILYIHPEQE